MQAKIVGLFVWIFFVSNKGLHSLAMERAKMASTDNYGTHFVLGFAANPLKICSKKFSIWITIISKQNSNVTISSLFYNSSFLVSKNKTVVKPLPIGLIINGTGVQENGIEVNSTNDIAVVCSYRTHGSHYVGYLVLPSQFLGKYYVVASYANNSYIGIISVNNNTLVKVTFAVDVNNNYKNGTTHSFILGKVGTFDISSKRSIDLSGTIIKANDTIAVISGSTYTGMKEMCSFVMTFMVPVKRWGYEYFLSVREGGTFKVFVSQNKTKILNYQQDHNTGRYLKFQAGSSLGRYINCSKPCQVVQYRCFQGNKYKGGPSMVVVHPLNEFLSYYKVDIVGKKNGHIPPITVFVKKSDRNNFRLRKYPYRTLPGGWNKFNVTTKYVWRLFSKRPNGEKFFSSTNTSFALQIENTWSITSKGAIKVYKSFKHLVLGKDSSADATSKTSTPMVYKNCRIACALQNIIVTSSNVAEVSQNVSDTFFHSAKDLTVDDIIIGVSLLEDIVAANATTEEVADNVLNTTNSILNVGVRELVAGQQRQNSSKRVIEMLNAMLETVHLNENKTFQRTFTNLAVDVSIIDTTSYSGVTFSGNISTSLTDSDIVKTSTDKTTYSPNGVSISLPRTIFNETETEENHALLAQTVIFTLFREAKLFQTSNSQMNRFSRGVNSYVIAGDIKGRPVSNLKTPVVLSFASLEERNKSTTSCMFWNIKQSHWDHHGCKFHNVSADGRVVCHCYHLTSFTVLMDINIEDDEVLSIISYIGCGISLVGLLLTITTILLFRDLRSNAPTQILLNFCLSLSLTLVVFLAGAERSRTFSATGCRIAAIALHYFILTTFMWMAISAFNMYLAFVKVLNSYFPKFMLKCSIVAWGIPIVIVGITMAVALDYYDVSKYCRLTGVPFLVAYLAPILLIIAGNAIAFVLIFRSLLKTGSKTSADLKITGYQQARQGAAIFVLLGLTWLFGVLAIGDARIVFQYLFCIFNSLQGLFVFLLYCLLSPGTREKYRRFFDKKFQYKVRQKRKSSKRIGAKTMEESHTGNGITEVEESGNVHPETLSTGV